MLENASSFDRVVVAGLFRLGSTASRVDSILTRLRAADCELVSLAENFDTGEAHGQTVASVLAKLARAEAEPWDRRGWRIEGLQRHGFTPETLVDVGAAGGTPELYKAFPKARQVLIEPLVEFAPDLDELVKEHGGEVIMTAVGASNGVTTLNVAHDFHMTSALETVAQLDLRSQRQVPLTTLDTLFEQRNWKPPIGLKLDVEGFETEVVRGAQRLLRATQFVIAEASVTTRFQGEKSSGEFIATMASLGFQVCDVIDAKNSVLGIHADLLFKRRP
jgi:FkbM family methyltransferase